MIDQLQIPPKAKEEMRNSFKKNGCAAATDARGFDDYYLILGGADLEAQDALLAEDASQLSKNKLARAFSKVNEKRGASRVLLARFIKLIAEKH